MEETKIDGGETVSGGIEAIIPASSSPPDKVEALRRAKELVASRSALDIQFLQKCSFVRRVDRHLVHDI